MTNSNDSNLGQSKAAEELKDSAANLAKDARDTATNVLQDARSEAEHHAEGAKANVADEMSGIASALRTAAGDLRSGSPQARTFGQIAEGLADASESLRDKDMGELMRDASHYARRNPLVFLGGAVLVGFAAARFAKASSEAGDHLKSNHTSHTSTSNPAAYAPVSTSAPAAPYVADADAVRPVTTTPGYGDRS